MAELVVAPGALPARAADLRRTVDELTRHLEDADRLVTSLRRAWDGDAALSFAGAWTAWRGSADAVGGHLAALRAVLDATDAAHGVAQRALVGAWSDRPSPAGPASVVAMSVAPTGLGDAPPWVTLSTPEIARAAQEAAIAQDALVRAAGGGRLEASAGFAGRDAALTAWRGRYDALGRRTWDAVAASVAIFGGVAVGLTDTANAWVEADEIAVPGGVPGQRLPAPAVLPALPGAGPAPAAGPGRSGLVPDQLAPYWPDIDADRVDDAGRAWGGIGDAVARSVVHVDGALCAVQAANAGPVFDAIDRYWRGVQGPMSGALLDLATRVPGVLATNLERLAEIVRDTQQELLDAMSHHPLGDDDDETYYLLQGAKIGVSFLGTVGRAGTRLIDAAETGLRIHLARRRYEDVVGQLVIELDQRMIGQLVDATREPRTVASVAPQFAPPPTTVGDIPLPPLSFDRGQLEEKFREHHDDFGVAGTSAADRRRFQDIVTGMTGDASLVHVRGRYRGAIDVIFHVDARAGLMVMQREDGSFLSAWRLNPEQLDNIVERQQL